MYYNLFPKSCKAVVLVLNLLDSLGDNQVWCFDGTCLIVLVSINTF
jgi:hypothetical protein